MKRFISLLLVLMIFCSAAMAEEAASGLPFAIHMDQTPAGYTMETTENGSDLIVVFTPEDPEALCVYVVVAYIDAFEGQTLDHDLTDAEKADVAAAVMGEYAEPSIEVRSTEYGTRLIVIDENGAESDYADLITVWQGYLIDIALQKNTEITEDDLALAVQIAGSLWIDTKE